MVVDDTYKTIEAPSEGLYKEKGSKFIALAFPASSEEQVKEVLDELRKSYHDARHHCYAYSLGARGDKWRMNDDGEPSGTAGKPIYGQLQSFEVTNILAVVIRYFGGTKLGVSGLINAYKTATHDALANAKVITKTVNDIFKLTFGYTVMNDIMRIIKETDVEIKSQNFDNVCSIVTSVRQKQVDEFLQRVKKVDGAAAEYLSTE
ncbi:MAG: YigZ family protein [Bacteroidales bacterium]|nr:YigZ family protein [Bacteroidales bacterium]HPD96106.1 YigZ family protein [Tenuifilaceae bacterium]HRX31401.1 YigZ family protein [Tenuifilaceae bacterium]